MRCCKDSSLGCTPVPSDSIFAVVATPEGMSLRSVGVEFDDPGNPRSRMRFFLTDGERVVAPFVRVEKKLGPFVVTICQTPRCLLRVDVGRAVPSRAAPRVQIDWLLAENAPRILDISGGISWCATDALQKTWLMFGGSDAHAVEDAVGLIRVSLDASIHCEVLNRPLAESFASSYRRIQAEIAKPAPAGWLPVLVLMRTWAGIRWLRVAVGAHGDAPAPATERRPVPLRLV